MRVAIWVLLLAGLLLAPRAVRAEPAVLALPTTVVGVSADRGGWQREMDARIDAAIRRAGRSPRAPGPLTSAELICRDAACLARIAEHANAGIVLGAKVVADRGSPPSYSLVLTRYDHDLPGAVRQEEAECSVCTQAETAERLGQMVSAMLPSLVVQSPRPVTVEPVAVVVTPVVRDEGPSLRTRHALIGVSVLAGVAGLALLGAGAWALAVDGHATTSPVGMAAPELYDTKMTGIGLTTSGGLHVLGATLALVFEIRALNKSKR